MTRTRPQRIVEIHDVALDAFAFTDEIEPARPSVWHTHVSHQLLYAAKLAREHRFGSWSELVVGRVGPGHRVEATRTTARRASSGAG